MKQVFLAISICCCFATAFAAESEWSFIWVSSGIDKYYVSNGKANVSISNGKIEAHMRSSQGVEYKLIGVVEKGKINAKFTVLASDYFIDSPFSGNYKVQRWSGLADSKGRESITLTDGWNFIGLSREIH